MTLASRLSGRMYYGWVVVGVTALTVLVAAGVRAAPAVLIHPLEEDFGWARASISLTASIGLFLYGISSPISGAIIDRYGPRWLMLGGISLVGASTILSATVTELWQLHLLWGFFSGIGTGLAAAVLAATVATRWFVKRRGFVVGLLGASVSAGNLVFVPLLMWLFVRFGWQSGVLILGVILLSLLPMIWLLMRDSPRDVGARVRDDEPEHPELASTENTRPGRVMATAIRVPEFWLLSATFFICGATSNGIIGTHLIPHSIDIGIREVTAASIIGIMGAMNFVGTIGSGILTDRYDPRKLLAMYYILRGLSLFLLPFVAGFWGLVIFAIVFGLDYIATVPPTVALTADIFGRERVGTVYGWIFLAHQSGAGAAAYLGGYSRDALGDYQLAFLAAGGLAIAGGLMALCIFRRGAPERELDVVPART
ncbi:MAG: MFS transporter [Thermomicrobiaceae bacterium]